MEVGGPARLRIVDKPPPTADACKGGGGCRRRAEGVAVRRICKGDARDLSAIAALREKEAGRRADEIS